MKKGILLLLLIFFFGVTHSISGQVLNHFDQHVSEESKKILTKYEEVTKVHAINDDKSLIVAIEIHHHDRLRLNSLEKQFKKEIEDKFLGYEVIVSLDKKIVMETHEMEKKIKNNAINNKDLSKKMKKIIDLSNDKA